MRIVIMLRHEFDVVLLVSTMDWPDVANYWACAERLCSGCVGLYIYQHVCRWIKVRQSEIKRRVLS